VSIKEAKNRLTALARLVEKGQTVVVTRNGKPIFDLVPHRSKGGLTWTRCVALSASIGSAE
jgi:prevent-host-death family protein